MVLAVDLRAKFMAILSNLQRQIWVSLKTNSRRAIRNKRRHWGGSLKGYFPKRELTLRLSRQFNIPENQVFRELEAIRQYFVGDS